MATLAAIINWYPVAHYRKLVCANADTVAEVLRNVFAPETTGPFTLTEDHLLRLRAMAFMASKQVPPEPAYQTLVDAVVKFTNVRIDITEGRAE